MFRSLYRSPNQQSQISPKGKESMDKKRRPTSWNGPSKEGSIWDKEDDKDDDKDDDEDDEVDDEDDDEDDDDEDEDEDDEDEEDDEKKKIWMKRTRSKMPTSADKMNLLEDWYPSILFLFVSK